jgi:dihydrofolate synthase/folylpolyglutamate synthase
MSSDKLLEASEKMGLKGYSIPDVKTAFDCAKTNASANDLIFVGGSIFVLAEIL